MPPPFPYFKVNISCITVALNGPFFFGGPADHRVCPKKRTKSSKLQWFQYRIIHRILGTNSLLYEINKKPNDKFSFCLEEVETIEHIF
jgi:hypothetical protein